VCFGGVNRNRLFMAASHSLYALYVNVLPQRVSGREELVYVRNVFSLGVTISF
jgi:hypothetical protein